MNTQVIKTPMQNIKDYLEERKIKRVRRLMNNDNIDMTANEMRMWLVIGLVVFWGVVGWALL